MACTSPLIHQLVSDGYFADWQHCRDVDTCSDNDVENHKNKARFSQIHQHLQYATYPSDFQKSDKQLCEKDLRLSSSRMLMATFTVGGGS